jgi:hypothetical protein
MIGMSCVGNPATRALTVAEADAEALGLAVDDAELDAVALLEAADEGLVVEAEVPEPEQPERRSAAATTEIRLPRRFHNFTATRILRNVSLCRACFTPRPGRAPGQV